MTRFFKLSGSGNDFIALARPEAEPSATQIAAWCSRGSSEGADGLLLLDPADEGVRMRYFNGDGRAARLCLNGTRCAARLAFELGWAKRSVAVVTGAGTFEAREIDATTVEMELPVPTAQIRGVELPVDQKTWSGWLLDVGVPHLILDWTESMSEAPVASLGPTLRRHPALGNEGANVDFVRFLERGRLEIRSFERGVEAETLACGTGVLAAAVVGRALERIELPLEAMTRGGFTIGLRDGGREGLWLLEGDARLVAEGTLRDSAEALPVAPDW